MLFSSFFDTQIKNPFEHNQILFVIKTFNSVIQVLVLEFKFIEKKNHEKIAFININKKFNFAYQRMKTYFSEIKKYKIIFLFPMWAHNQE